MKKLFFNTVGKDLSDVLGKLMQAECLKDFVLVGGTALSLQRGHRISVDIDLFTALPYGDMPTRQIKHFFENSFPVCENTETLNSASIGYSLRIGNVKDSLIKVDLFYTEPFIFPTLCIDGIRLADEKEISAMKMLAITSRQRRAKDFWDIRELMESYPLDKQISWGLMRNQFALSKADIINSLKAIDTVENVPITLTSKSKVQHWELVCMDIKAEVGKLV